MTETFSGCSHTELWVNPKNWKSTTSKAALQKSWYVQCKFFDPAFADKYPNGFPYRVKINKGNPTLEKRRAAAALMLEEIPKMFAESYNPITGQWMDVVEKETNPIKIYDTNTPVIEALLAAFELSGYTGHTQHDVKSVVKYVSLALKKLNFDSMPVSQFTGMHLKQVLDAVQVTTTTKKGSFTAPLTEKRHNKYTAYLSSLFKILIKNNMTSINPSDSLGKKEVIVEKRESFSMAERRKIDAHLKANYINFWRFMQIFFHSAGRETELLRLKVEDVDLDKLTYTSIIRKRKKAARVERAIKIIALPFWERVLTGAQKGDYIFSVGLVPGPQKIREDQISRRWREHVKKKLGIEKDFYLLKHTNITEISERSNPKTAGQAAGHVNDRMVKAVYDLNFEDRELDVVRYMDNEFAPDANKKLLKTKNITVQIPPEKEADFAVAMAKLVEMFAGN